jgi:hypothetical protein
LTRKQEAILYHCGQFEPKLLQSIKSPRPEAGHYSSRFGRPGSRGHGINPARSGPALAPARDQRQYFTSPNATPYLDSSLMKSGFTPLARAPLPRLALTIRSAADFSGSPTQQSRSVWRPKPSDEVTRTSHPDVSPVIFIIPRPWHDRSPAAIIQWKFFPWPSRIVQGRSTAQVEKWLKAPPGSMPGRHSDVCAGAFLVRQNSPRRPL